MGKGTRAAAMAAAALLGTGAAMAAAAGDGASMSAVPITIQGVNFKDGPGRSITINGVPFKRSSRGGTITINGVSLKKTGTLPRTLTINGVSFKGTPRTGTLPQTLTINGVAIQPNQAGPAGPPGPTGPAGPVLSGPPPKENGGPIVVKAGAGRITLAGAAHGTSAPRRLLVTGGFDLVCTSCTRDVNGRWSILRDGQEVVKRRFDTLSSGEADGVSFSEVVVSQAACPCDFRLVVEVDAGSAGGAGDELEASGVRIAVADLGAVSG